MENLDQTAVLATLNRALELELAGVVRYTHYSLMVYGYNRIPIVDWLRSQAVEGLAHAQQVGELITHFGEHPSLGIGPLLESQKHDIGDILRESLEHERETLRCYHDLLGLVRDKSVLLEEFARDMVAKEELHLGEVNKMLRRPGDIGAFRP
jgi:bacterioferritin